MKLGWRHLVLALAFIFWGACVLGGLSMCAGPQGDDHYQGEVSAGLGALLVFLFFAILIGGAWLLKRLALRLGIKID